MESENVNSLKDFQGEFAELGKCKVIVVGYGNVGKTSFIHSVMKRDFKNSMTDGVDVYEFSKERMTFYFWDFAGQQEYYTTHRFFMSNNSIVVLVWNMREKVNESDLEFWLNSIEMIVSGCPVLVVGTHLGIGIFMEISLKTRFCNSKFPVEFDEKV